MADNSNGHRTLAFRAPDASSGSPVNGPTLEELAKDSLNGGGALRERSFSTDGGYHNGQNSSPGHPQGSRLVTKLRETVSIPSDKTTIEFAVHEWSMQSASQDCLESPHFQPLFGQEWMISVLPKGLPNSDGSVVIALRNLNEIDTKFSASLSITGYYDENATCVSYPNCVLVPVRLVKAGGNLLLTLPKEVIVKDCSRVVFSISMTIFSQPVFHHGHDFIGGLPLRSIADDMCDFFESKKMSDIVLVAENVEVPCHTAILAARSSVWRKKLTKQFVSTRLFFANGRYPIAEMKGTELEAFCRFLYSDKVSEADLIQHSEGLLKTACKYNVVALKTICEQYLADAMMPDTAARCLSFAEENGCMLLMMAASEFICMHLQAVTEHDPSFKSLNQACYLCILNAQTTGHGEDGGDSAQGLSRSRLGAGAGAGVGAGTGAGAGYGNKNNECKMLGDMDDNNDDEGQ